jgi:hypothetical protein
VLKKILLENGNTAVDDYDIPKLLKEVSKILTECLEKLEKDGKLQELFGKIHKPYDNWQP